MAKSNHHTGTRVRQHMCGNEANGQFPKGNGMFSPPPAKVVESAVQSRSHNIRPWRVSSVSQLPFGPQATANGGSDPWLLFQGPAAADGLEQQEVDILVRRRKDITGPPQIQAAQNEHCHTGHIRLSFDHQSGTGVKDIPSRRLSLSSPRNESTRDTKGGSINITGVV
jgi:hypothetical protein